LEDNPGMTAAAPERERLDWVVPALLPAVNLGLALLLSAIVVLLIGESPGRALPLLVVGSLGGVEAAGYTVYYAPHFILTPLASASLFVPPRPARRAPFRGGLSTRAAEGHARMGGPPAAFLWPPPGGRPTALPLPAAIAVAAAGGAAWAFVPAWLQARRGSHV